MLRRRLSPLVLAAACASLLVAASGCRSVTSEDRQVISVYLENAAQYYEGGHFERAYQQWGRALEIDPDEERAQLGQAMALYQMGRELSKEGLRRLTEAEGRLDAMRGGELGDQSWKAELGYGLVQLRWTELYDRALRVHEQSALTGARPDPAKTEEARTERPRRARLAETAFQRVLDDRRTEPNFRMTAWLGLARATAAQGRLEESLRWCREFEKQVVKSREFWEKQGDAFASKLFGAQLQEAELRDVLGNTLFKLGRFDEAERELDLLVTLQPGRAAAWGNRGLVREARGAWDLARSDYAKFIELTDLPAGDPILLEAEKRRLLCTERMEAEDARLEQGLPTPR